MKHQGQTFIYPTSLGELLAIVPLEIAPFGGKPIAQYQKSSRDTCSQGILGAGYFTYTANTLAAQPGIDLTNKATVNKKYVLNITEIFHDCTFFIPLRSGFSAFSGVS